MIERIKHIWWVIKNLRPLQVRNLFEHIYVFGNFDPVIEDYKRAILYGRLYHERSKYDANGMLDTQERSRRVDAIIKQFKRPTDINDYIALLKQTKIGVIESERQGLITTPSPKKFIPKADGTYDVVIDYEQKKKEAAYYENAINCLNVLLAACYMYPKMWKSIFLQSA